MHNHLHHHHDSSLIVLSVLIAVFASYTALDLTNSVSASKGKIKWLWLSGGSLAMGVGIWSMHFIGMLAFNIPGLDIYYDVPLLLLSVGVAIVASALALFMASSKKPSTFNYILGSTVMGAAISGMHYIGIWSMRMAANIKWDYSYVIYSIVIAFCASYVALLLAFKLRGDLTLKGFLLRGAGGVVMGIAISGMHYTGMAAMEIIPNGTLIFIHESDLLATNGLAAAVIVGTILILGIALSGSNIERALSRRTVVNEALQAAIKARDDFFSIASHEFKTPLTSIKLQNELIIRNVVNKRFDENKLVSMLNSSGKNIDRLSRLVDDMLDISRLSSGKLTLQLEKFELISLIGEVIERLSPVIEEAGSQIRFKDHAEVFGNWDRFRIEQVITNIISNAIKYAPGELVKIEVLTDQEFAYIKIKDEGKGISPEDQERIFQRFERAEKSGDSRGLGLGLFISKEIIHMHKGEIKVHSEPGKGAEFTVILPF
jgi:signal transduction histidine kinase